MKVHIVNGSVEEENLVFEENDHGISIVITLLLSFAEKKKTSGILGDSNLYLLAMSQPKDSNLLFCNHFKANFNRKITMNRL